MKKTNENKESKSDRDILEEILKRISNIESEIAAIKFDIGSLKLSSPSDGSNIIGSSGGYISSRSGY